MADDPVNTPMRPSGPPSPRLDDLTPAQRAVHNDFLAAYDGLKQNLVRTIFYLRAVVDGKIHKHLGYSRITDYAQHYAGFSPRQTQELLVLGNRLIQLPQVAAALERGDLSWSLAREIARLANPEDQQKWVDVARSVSRRELRERMRHGNPDPPAMNTSPQLPVQSPQSLSAPPRSEDPGPSPAPAAPPPQHASAAPLPRRHAIPAGLPQPIDNEQHLRIKMTAEQYALWESLLENLRKQNPGLTPAQAMLDNLSAAYAAPQNSGTRSPYLVVLLLCPECGKARIPTSRGEAEAGSSLLAAAHCDAVIENSDATRRQVIMPRMRRQALQRARYTCEAGNCRHTRFLEIHHRVPVAGGGRTELDNLIVLCSRCHRLLHERETDLQNQRRRIEDIAHDWARNSKNSNEEKA
ncbi:MAG: HNH endonuclease signature motif containing protein [bacterium]